MAKLQLFTIIEVDNMQRERLTKTRIFCSEIIKAPVARVNSTYASKESEKTCQEMLQ